MPYEQDKFNQWWYINSRQRSKCKEYTCDYCGVKFHRLPAIASQAKDKKTKFCSRKCSNKVTAEKHKTSRKGSNNPQWKGGRIVTAEGYVKIYNPEHINADKKGYILEHRLVMEQKVKRLLTKTENVHHINGVKNDNTETNLELWVTSQPSGQRVQDLIAWAKTILSIYDK